METIKGACHTTEKRKPMLNEEELKQHLASAAQAANEAGKILRKYWGKLSQIEQKSYTWDLVTEADKESEELVIRFLSEQYPSYAILSEEAGLKEAPASALTWIVDPLDGTTNYTHQYPMVSVSIALVAKGLPVVGIVYDPIHEELYQAALNTGATLNGQRIHVSQVAKLGYSLVGTGFAYDRKNAQEKNYAEFCHITQQSQGVRRGGSAALDLAYVAAGRLDGYWERGLNPWDIAAGILLIQEAGGIVSSYEGDAFVLESGRILASNGIIHQELIEELQKVRQGKTPRYF